MSEATLTVSTVDPELAADAIAEFATKRDGYVESRKAQRASEKQLAVDVVIRVPAAELDATLVMVRRMGSVLSEAITGTDVTEEYADHEAELRAKRVVEQRLLAMVSGTKDVKDALAVETELGRVRSEVERLEGRLRFLADRTDFATVRASFASPVQVAVPEVQSMGSRLAMALHEGFTLGIRVAAGIVFLVVGTLPLGVPAAIVAAVIAVRRRRALRAVSAVSAAGSAGSGL
jgi:hypothetical protein